MTSRFWTISSLPQTDGITVLPIMEFFNPMVMEANTEMTELEKWLEEQNDPSYYPDGFDPSLYDL